MRDDLYIRTHRRIQRRLSGPPRLGTLHALAFTAFTVPMALFTGVFMRSNALEFLVLGAIMSWSLLLFLHAGYGYLNSGARRRRRERMIQEEVLDAGDSFDLTEDEMIGLHTRLEETVRSESQAHVRLLANATANLLFWPGLVIAIPLMAVFFGVMSSGSIDGMARILIALSAMGTCIAAGALPFRALRGAPPDETDNLRAVYGYKRKRALPVRHDEAAERLSIGDDGELIPESIDEPEEYDFRQAE